MSALVTNNSGGALTAPSKNRPALTGPMKASLWLLSVEEKIAIDALTYLSDAEIIRIRQTTQSLTRVDPEDLNSIHAEFFRLLDEAPLRVYGSIDYLSQLTTKALGSLRAASLFAPKDKLPTSFELAAADSATLSAMLTQEHPQVIAAILASLGAKRAADILMRFDVKLRQEVIVRLAQLRTLPQSSLLKAQQLLATKMPTESTRYQMDGLREVATVLNQLASDTVDDWLVNLPEQTLAQKIREAMFTFEDLVKLDKRSMQVLLKEVSNAQLIMALKAASGTVQEKIFGCVSQRAGAAMREELELMGPTRISEVEAAQTAIVTIALNLRNEGKITLGSQASEMV